jgi:hypothetical protein
VFLRFCACFVWPSVLRVLFCNGGGAILLLFWGAGFLSLLL